MSYIRAQIFSGTRPVEEAYYNTATHRYHIWNPRTNTYFEHSPGNLQVSFDPRQTIAHLPNTAPTPWPTNHFQSSLPAGQGTYDPTLARTQPGAQPVYNSPGDLQTTQYTPRGSNNPITISRGDVMRLPGDSDTWTVQRIVPNGVNGNNSGHTMIQIQDTRGNSSFLDFGNNTHHVYDASDHTLSQFTIQHGNGPQVSLNSPPAVAPSTPVRPPSRGGATDVLPSSPLRGGNQLTTAHPGVTPRPPVTPLNQRFMADLAGMSGAYTPGTNGGWHQFPTPGSDPTNPAARIVRDGSSYYLVDNRNGGSWHYAGETAESAASMARDYDETGNPWGLTDDGGSGLLPDANPWRGRFEIQRGADGREIFYRDGEVFDEAGARRYDAQQQAAGLRTQNLLNAQLDFRQSLSRLSNSNEMLTYTINGRRVNVWGYDNGRYEAFFEDNGARIAEGTIGDVGDKLGELKAGQDPSGANGQGGSQKSSRVMDRIQQNPVFLVATAGMAGLGLYKTFQNMYEKFDASQILYMMQGVMQFIQSAGALLSKFMTQNHADLAAALAVVAIGIAAKLFQPKKDNELDTANGDAPAMANANQPTSTGTNTSTTQSGSNVPARRWFSGFRGNNVLMITSAAALMAIGLNLGIDGPANDHQTYEAKEMAGVRAALDSSVGGGKIDANPESVLGKLFIRSSQNNGMTDDQLVYVTKDTIGTRDKPAEYSATVLSLNYNGFMISPELPNLSHRPLFRQDDNGALVATTAGNTALGHIRALSQGASSQSLTARNAAAAAQMAGGVTHGIDPTTKQEL